MPSGPETTEGASAGDVGTDAAENSPQGAARNAQRRVRLIGNGLFAALVAAITATFAWQVIDQSFWPKPTEPEAACRPGVLELQERLEQARQSAASFVPPKEALSVFRKQLDGQANRVAALHAACAGDRPAIDLLLLLERLRYSEELALRTELERVHRLRAAVASASTGLRAAETKSRSKQE